MMGKGQLNFLENDTSASETCVEKDKDSTKGMSEVVMPSDDFLHEVQWRPCLLPPMCFF